MNINLTLIGQSITFAIFVWFCMKYVWPPIINALDARKKRIADGLAAAERGHQKLEQASRKTEELLLEARDKAQDILAQADKRAVQLIEDAKATAKTEGERLIAGAKAEISQDVSHAKEALRAQVAALAITTAEKILQREVDIKAHADLVRAAQSEL